MAINYVGVKEISPEFAEKWKGESGVELHLAIHKHDQGSAFWINNMFEVYKSHGPFLEGDKVIVQYNYCETLYGSNRENGQSEVHDVAPDGSNIFYIPFECVQLIIRGEELIPPVGTCLCTRVKNETMDTTLYVQQEEYKRDLFVVRFLGEPTPEHLIRTMPVGGMVKGRAWVDPVGRKLTEAIPSVGDMILSQKGMGLPIESPMNKKLDMEYWILPYSQVMAVYEIIEQ